MALAHKLRATLTGFAFIAPLLAGIAVFQLYPMIIAVYAYFIEWYGLLPPSWTGLRNYVMLLTADPMFAKVVGTTGLYMLGAIPLTMILALTLATLTSPQRRIMVGFRLAFFVPFVANAVAVSIVWFRLFSGR